MSVSILPNEILDLIFDELDIESLCTCRVICRRWKEIVDSRNDFWKEVCGHKYWCSQKAFEKTSLSWRDMLKSLALWPNIKYATMTTKEIPKPTSYVKLLKNNVISVLGKNHAIIYYDVNTLQKLDQLEVGFPFTHYDENEKLIAIPHKDGRLCVILKSNKTQHFVGNLCESLYGGTNSYKLFDDGVYFQNCSDMLCLSKIVEKKGVVKIKTEELEDFQEYIVDMFVGHDYLNILTDEGNIYTYRNKDFEYVSQVDHWLGEGVTYELWEFGFDYVTNSVFYWLKHAFDKRIIKITHFNATAIHRHGRVILIGTAMGVLHIYVNPYDPNGNLRLYRAAPNLSISLNSFGLNKIIKLDVVETEFGHQIIASSNKCAIILEFSHKNEKIVLRSKKSQQTITQSPSNSSNKNTGQPKVQNKIVKPKSTVVKHRYMTRSTTKK